MRSAGLSLAAKLLEHGFGAGETNGGVAAADPERDGCLTRAGEMDVAPAEEVENGDHDANEQPNASGDQDRLPNRADRGLEEEQPDEPADGGANQCAHDNLSDRYDGEGRVRLAAQDLGRELEFVLSEWPAGQQNGLIGAKALPAQREQSLASLLIAGEGDDEIEF